MLAWASRSIIKTRYPLAANAIHLGGQAYSAGKKQLAAVMASAAPNTNTAAGGGGGAGGSSGGGSGSGGGGGSCTTSDAASQHAAWCSRQLTDLVDGLWVLQVTVCHVLPSGVGSPKDQWAAAIGRAAPLFAQLLGDWYSQHAAWLEAHQGWPPAAAPLLQALHGPGWRGELQGLGLGVPPGLGEGGSSSSSRPDEEQEVLWEGAALVQLAVVAPVSALISLREAEAIHEALMAHPAAAAALRCAAATTGEFARRFAPTSTDPLAGVPANRRAKLQALKMEVHHMVVRAEQQQVGERRQQQQQQQQQGVEEGGLFSRQVVEFAQEAARVVRRATEGPQ